MAHRFQSFQALGSKSAVSPTGRAAPAAAGPIRLTVTWSTDPRDGTSLIGQFPSPGAVTETIPLGAELVAAEVGLALPHWYATTSLDSLSWVLTEEAGTVVPMGQADLTLATTTPRTAASSGPSLVVLERRPCLVMDDATATACGIANASTTSVCVWYRDRSSTRSNGLFNFGAFIDDTVTNQDHIAYLLDQLGANVTQYYLGARGNTEIRVNGATLAGPDVTNTLFIRASDIGNQPWNIPLSVAANTAEALRFYPSIFFRRGAYMRGVSLLDNASEGIATADGAPFLYTVTADVQFSAWEITVDGSTERIIIDANGMTGQRTPREIWEGNLLPRLEYGLPIYKIDTIGDAFLYKGTLKRMDYLNHARFLWAWDEEPSSVILTPYAQTGNPAPAP